MAAWQLVKKAVITNEKSNIKKMILTKMRRKSSIFAREFIFNSEKPIFRILMFVKKIGAILWLKRLARRD